ncbi:MAG: O-antigen ligase family protein [Erythrobacter sp.]|nr:MAG: O-antigen ligase family protein [Erythrobacter sp.]
MLVAPLLHLQALVVLALAIGGGGVAYGLHNLAIQLAALALLAVHAGRLVAFVEQAPRLLLALLLLSLAFPLLQIIPLPPTIWQELPGRAPVVESHALAGIDPATWAPLSLDPARSLVAFLGMFAPAAIIAIGSTLASEERARLALTMAAAAFAAMLLGTVQLASVNSTAMIYPISPAPDVLYATFANRNSTGLLFVLSLILLAALPLAQRRLWLLARGVAATLLAFGVVLTQSRSAMVLLVPAGAFVLVRLAFAAWQRRVGRALHPAPISPQTFMAGVALAGVLAAILGVSALSGGRVAESLDRFDRLETDRVEMWDDAYFATGNYWPVGSGMGTFDEVFQLHESLEYVSPRKAGRAHSDWLEIAIEGGIIALLLAGAWLAWVLFSVLRGPAKGDGWLHFGAGTGLGCIALQSLLDYPLRNQALLCAAAVLVVLVARQREPA